MGTDSEKDVYPYPELAGPVCPVDIPGKGGTGPEEDGIPK